MTGKPPQLPHGADTQQVEREGVVQVGDPLRGHDGEVWSLTSNKKDSTFGNS